jgi:enoyl-CoA hydratase
MDRKARPALMVATGYGLIRQWEERPLKESVDLSIAVFGQSFLSGEPQRLMQGFVNRKR